MITNDISHEAEAFDAEWYARAFPDVALTGLAPWDHFQKYGRAMGRAPNGQVTGQGPELTRPEPVDTPVTLHAGALEIARFQADQSLSKPLAPLRAYLGMLGLDPNNVEVTGALDGLEDGAPGLGEALLQGAPVTLGTLWFADAMRLRLSLSVAAPVHLRLYQAPPEAPEALALVGGAALDGEGPAFVDAPLFNPLMPLLIEVAAPDGMTEGLALVPFPSLARGGLHAAERAAWQAGRDPMADFWRLSASLLDEMLSPGAPVIGSVSAENLPEDVTDWLGAVFDLTGKDLTGKGALELVLGPDMVPTLAALVSRRLGLPEGADQVAGPMLVADAVDYRPMWSVALPALADLDVAHTVPRLRRKGRVAEATVGHALAPLHLAIRLSTPSAVTDILTVLPPETVPEVDLGITLALRATEAACAGRALAALSLQEGVDLKRVLVQVPEDTVAGEEVLHVAEGLFPGRVQRMPPEAGLDALNAAADGDALLMMDEAVLPYDPATLAGLAALLQGQEAAATVSCALLHEAEFRKATRVQVASVGLFPMGMSFAAAPRLTVGTPDVLTALPDVAYPVLGNTFDLCLIRRSVITETEGARQSDWSDTHAGLKFALDARAKGWISLSTTAIRAGTTVLPAPLDEIDPIGLACLMPEDWATLVSEVTLVRELRG